MIAYEFSTQMTEVGILAIPAEYAKQVRPGSRIKVILMADEFVANPNQNTEFADSSVLKNEEETFEQWTERIQKTPIDPLLIQLGNMELFSAHLATSLTDSPPEIDPVAWQQLWARHEAEIKTRERAKELEELQKMAQMFQKWQPV